MKILFIYISAGVFFACRVFCELPPDFRRIEAEQVALWEQKLKEARMLPSEVRTAQLGLGLRNMAYRKTFDVHSPEVDLIYQRISDELVSIPGHARFFKNQLENEWAVRRPNDSYDNFGMHVLCYIEQTLAHLPSPETIGVLGFYLNDERVPLRPMMAAQYPEPQIAAFEALSRIGLRNLPEAEPPPTDRATPQETMVAIEATRARNLHRFRTWWEEVKAGTKTFSFQGQNVEYRFQPDGTWDTIPIANPPDGGPKSASVKKMARPVRRFMPDQADSNDASRGISWWWYGIGGVALLAACAWFWGKKRGN